VFWDNAPWHTSAEVKKALIDLGIQPVYNMKYSPEWNPIELMFGWLKKEFRQLRLAAMVNEIKPNYYELVR
jgi:transposase